MFYSVIETRDFSLFNQSAQALLKVYFIMKYMLYSMRQVTELACFKFNFNLKLNVNLLAELIKEQTGGCCC